MLRISHNDKFLVLQPGASIDMERNSPLFLVDNVLAEYTFPVTILDCEQNWNILGYDVFADYGLKSIKRFDVTILDDGLTLYSAILVIDKSINNRSNTANGGLQGYVLRGISDFFNQVKDKKVRDLVLGGRISFSFTSWNPDDASNGWWQYFHRSWIDPNMPFVMVPCRNETWIEDETFTGWMNQLGANGKVLPFTWPVLWPRVKYVLQQMFQEHGWRLDTTGLYDTVWEKLLLVNVNPIQTTSGDEGGSFPAEYLTFELRNCISPEITCSDLLLSLCRRYGWAPIFDTDVKTCRLVALKNVVDQQPYDISIWADTAKETEFAERAIVTSYINRFGGNDGFPSKPDFSTYKIEPQVNTKGNLPAPDIKYDNSVIFVAKENAWFKIVVNASNEREWEYFASNIYDLEPKDVTQTIETNAAPVPVLYTQYRNEGGNNYYGYFPTIKNPRNKEWGIRTAIYHGMVVDLTAAGAAGNRTYPYASSHNVGPNGSVLSAWADVWQFSYQGTEYGIVNYWYNVWQNYTKFSSPINKRIHIPLDKVQNLKFDKPVNIRNEMFILKQLVERTPYPGYIDAVLQPVVLNAESQSDVPGLGIVYLKYTSEEEAAGADINDIYGTPWQTDVILHSATVRAYKDAACTEPIAVANLRFNWKTREIINGVETSNTTVEILMNGTFWKLDQAIGSKTVKTAKFISNNHPYVVQYSIEAGNGYVVVP